MRETLVKSLDNGRVNLIEADPVYYSNLDSATTLVDSKISDTSYLPTIEHFIFVQSIARMVVKYATSLI